MDSFISIPPIIKQSSTPTPDSRRGENSPAPSGGVGTPVPASSGSAVGGGGGPSVIKTEDESEEELRRSEAAVETLQQMDLWSLVLDLMTRIQEGTVTAKTVDNEAGIIRARISRARMSLKHVTGLDVSMGERKEEILRLEEAIQKKRDLLVRFQAVMGGNSNETEWPSATVVSIKKEPGTGEENTSSGPPVKEESVDPITDISNFTGNGVNGDEAVPVTTMSAGLDVPAPNDLDVFMSGIDGVQSGGDNLPVRTNGSDEMKPPDASSGLLYDMPLDTFEGFDF